MAGIMSPHHKEIIDVELRKEFIRELHLDEEFLAVMRKDNCITEDLMEQVQIKLRLNGSQVGVSEFLTGLKMRPERAFKQFVRALVETHQDHLAALVDRELEKRGEQEMSPDIMNSSADVTDRNSQVPSWDEAVQKIATVVGNKEMDLSKLTITPMSASTYKSRLDRKVSYGDKAQQTGRVIIINNEEVFLQKRRKGSVADVENLTNLFNLFKFEVITEQNKTAEEMIEFLTKQSTDADLKNIDILIVILMSHGKSNVVLGCDGKSVHIHPPVLTDDNPVDTGPTFTSLFSNKNCPYMAGKPKLFIIQACQTESVETYEEDFKNPDTYIAMAAVAGDSAYRILTAGSLFIRATIYTIANYSHYKELSEMMALASDAVRKIIVKIKEEEKFQLPKAIDTLTKECYLIHPDSTI